MVVLRVQQVTYELMDINPDASIGNAEFTIDEPFVQ